MRKLTSYKLQVFLRDGALGPVLGYGAHALCVLPTLTSNAPSQSQVLWFDPGAARVHAIQIGILEKRDEVDLEMRAQNQQRLRGCRWMRENVVLQIPVEEACHCAERQDAAVRTLHFPDLVEAVLVYELVR